MDEFSESVVQTLFWSLAACAIGLPMRWSVLSVILLSHIDVTSRNFASAASVGWENAIKTLLVPGILMLRFCRRRLSGLQWNSPLALWILLTAYAAVGVMWSPFQLSGLKMVGYLCCYLMLAAIFLEGWERSELTPGLLSCALWLSLLLGVIQTFVLTSPSGVAFRSVTDDRFTSFSSPQSYAAFLLAVLSILNLSRSLPWWVRIANGIGGLTGLFFCGSRYVFLGIIPLFFIVWVVYVRKSAPKRNGSLRLVFAMAALLLGLSSIGFVLYREPDSRIGQLFSVLAEGDSPFERIGTLVWRRGIYEHALWQLSARSLSEILCGSGTSSGALVVLGYDLRYTDEGVDANRVVHNEVLRVLYEWGLIGLVLFIGFFGSIVFRLTRAASKYRIVPAFAFLSLLPTVMLGFLSENILAASSLPVGVGFLLSLTYGLAYERLIKSSLRQFGMMSLEGAENS